MTGFLVGSLVEVAVGLLPLFQFSKSFEYVESLPFPVSSSRKKFKVKTGFLWE
jgi:hypothetical protein